VDILIGNAAKAKKILGWEAKTRFNDLVRLMVDADMKLFSRETPREHLGKLP
jgi:GDPmannose 4,6-dehydratase